MLDLKKATESNFTDVQSDVFKSRFFGSVPYQDSLDLQNEAHQEVSQNPNQIHLLGLEHPTVITLGRRGNTNDAQVHESHKLIPVVMTSRGGLATLHSPGQLVIYPVLHLQSHELSVKEYVQLLLSTTKKLLGELGIISEISLDNAGVFTSAGKIAFCGVEIKNRITQHGISINVSNDLKLFRHIIPCGYSQQSLDRIANHGLSLEPCDLFGRWSRLFLEKFKSN